MKFESDILVFYLHRHILSDLNKRKAKVNDPIARLPQKTPKKFQFRLAIKSEISCPSENTSPHLNFQRTSTYTLHTRAIILYFSGITWELAQEERASRRFSSPAAGGEAIAAGAGGKLIGNKFVGSSREARTLVGERSRGASAPLRVRPRSGVPRLPHPRVPPPPATLAGNASSEPRKSTTAPLRLYRRNTGHTGILAAASFLRICFNCVVAAGFRHSASILVLHLAAVSVWRAWRVGIASMKVLTCASSGNSIGWASFLSEFVGRGYKVGIDWKGCAIWTLVANVWFICVSVYCNRNSH